MPNKEELLQCINPGMKLEKALFLRIYGYEVSFPGYAEIAIKTLESMGCSKAGSYYNAIVEEYEEERKENLKPIARWLKERDEREKGEELRKQQTIQNLTADELTQLCKRLLQEGIIASPEQLATVVS